MRAFRDISIKNKLSAIILLTSTVVLLLASTAFVTNELFSLRRNLIADLYTVSEIFAFNSSAGLLFNDANAVNENMSALKAKSHIIEAHIFDENGKIFASYYRHDLEDKTPSYENLVSFYLDKPVQIPENAQNAEGEEDLFAAFLQQPGENSGEAIADGSEESLEQAIKQQASETNHSVNLMDEEKLDQFLKSIKDEAFFRNQHAEVFQKIVFDNEFLGFIYIRSDLEELDNRLFWAAAIVFAVMGASLLLAFFLASRLQIFITRPLYSLLEAMKLVSRNKNYSIRSEKWGEDELGSLVEGFNNMLAQIEIRDKELNQYHNHLEEKVEQRTKELAEARDQALAANKAKSVFLANMSHEIRTPMNAVLGYAQILQRDTILTKEQRASLQIIENSGNHLLGLINDILDISKIEAGAMELRLENFYLGELIEAISAMFKIRCEQRNLDWRVESTIKEHTLVHADQGKLRQILINLLGNAVKFTDKGEVVLRVSEVELDKYRFDVIDTGQGIAPDDQQKIFEPFQQEKSGFDKGGTGLGLAITKRQVELMHGEVHLSSEQGKGACFTVLLPLPEGEGEVVIHTERSQISHLAAHCKVYALVVDDVKENRDILSHMLRDVGVEVEEAFNGQDCLDHVANRKPDIIFTDIRMPVMDGMDMIREIRQGPHADVVCVAISASTLHHQTKDILAAGFDDFISKPFRFEMVYDCIVKLLEVEFEYADQPTGNEEIEEDINIDINQVVLDKSLYDRLYEAAELSDLTELEELLKELAQGNNAQQALGELFYGYLSTYDIDSVLETLEHIQQHTTENEEVEGDINQVVLDKSFYDRLYEAAELSDLTELEELIKELAQGNNAQQALGELFHGYLSTYDIDSVLEALEHIQHT